MNTINGNNRPEVEFGNIENPNSSEIYNISDNNNYGNTDDYSNAERYSNTDNYNNADDYSDNTDSYNNTDSNNNGNGSAPVDTSVYSKTGKTIAGKPDRKRKKRSRLRISSALTITLLVVTCICVLGSLYIIKRCRMRIEVIDGKPTILTENQFKALKNATEDSVTEDIRQILKKRLESGDSATYLLRVYYPEYMVFMDEGIYKFTEIDNSLKMNKLKRENFHISDKGELTYSENGTVISHKGIDLSKYQGNVDFAKVKEDGVEYAIIRCGYRGYGSGAIVPDENWGKYAQGASDNGIKVGAYFFTQAITAEEAVEEANFVLDAIKPYNVTYPVVIDIEDVDNKNTRQKELSPKELTDVVIAFCDTVKAAGYTPMIYSNISYYGGKLEYSRLEEYDKWFASYTTTLYFPYEIAMWQYTSTGTINGINGNVDVNISFKDWN